MAAKATQFDKAKGRYPKYYVVVTKRMRLAADDVDVVQEVMQSARLRRYLERLLRERNMDYRGGTTHSQVKGRFLSRGMKPVKAAK